MSQDFHLPSVTCFHLSKLLAMKRLFEFAYNMATFAVVLSLFVIAVVSLLGFIFAAISLYLAYLHWKSAAICLVQRESFFSGNIPHILRERKRGKIIHEIVDDMHCIYGPVVLMWAYHRPFTFFFYCKHIRNLCVDPELVRKCLITLNLSK